MAQRITPQHDISTEEVLRREVIVNQALIEILIAKKIISEKELVNFIQKIRMEHGNMLKWQP